MTRRTAFAAGLLLLAAGCAPVGRGIPDAALPDYYALVQQELLARGLMRTEAAPRDAPITLNSLVENFVEIALFDEFGVSAGRFVERREATALRRWERPVRVGILIGESVSPAQAEEDRRNVAAFTARLARLTGLDMTTTNDGLGNFTVMFLDRAEQRDFARFLAAEDLTSRPVIASFADSPPEAFCIAYTFGSDNPAEGYGAALILVKAEHRDLMRLSCIHEEMAQALGLPNDSFRARPTIFNDDEEFALLTKHDEILLRMLYDRRLAPGMTEAQIRPLLPTIARDAARAAGVKLGAAS
ncbi:MAG: DUF2927 domain-containing protein [Pseudomonadota bacterium]